jgi:hypothetical protein
MISRYEYNKTRKNCTGVSYIYLTDIKYLFSLSRGCSVNLRWKGEQLFFRGIKSSL